MGGDLSIIYCNAYKIISEPACKPSSVLRYIAVATIPLDRQSLTGSSNQPVSGADHTIWKPIRSCSGWSLPCHGLLPAARCALTAPFHPYLIPLARAIGGLLSVALVVGFPPRRYLAPCPMEPGLSSPPPVSPEEDDDEAATVWSASARSIEGLRGNVTPHCAFLSLTWRRCFLRRDKYCQMPHGRPLPAY